MKKLYVDTNVFLRFLLRDNIKQADVAEKNFTLAKEEKVKIVIISEIIPELVYVLSGIYKLSREKVTKYIESIVKTIYFNVEQRDTWVKVMGIYPQVSVDVEDIFLAVKAKEEDGDVLSFDKDFKKLEKHL
ncbi:PIN domain-containing protein [Patescibacteria group bacterium]|nr:PIN domain-containing protein [Patescibacteria group bacterium]